MKAVLIAGCTVAMVMFALAPASAAVEQCRFIKAKPDREACYARQDAARAEKQKAQGSKPVMERELARMKAENDRVTSRLRSICIRC